LIWCTVSYNLMEIISQCDATKWARRVQLKILPEGMEQSLDHHGDWLVRVIMHKIGIAKKDTKYGTKIMDIFWDFVSPMWKELEKNPHQERWMDLSHNTWGGFWFLEKAKERKERKLRWRYFQSFFLSPLLLLF